MHQNPNLIPRLVYDFLLKSGYNTTANIFATECPHLSGLKHFIDSQTGAKILHVIVNPNLFDIVDGFFTTWERKSQDGLKLPNSTFTYSHTPLTEIQSGNSEAKTSISVPSGGFVPPPPEERFNKNLTDLINHLRDSHSALISTTRSTNEVFQSSEAQSHCTQSARLNSTIALLQNQLTQGGRNACYPAPFQGTSSSNTSQNAPDQNQKCLLVPKISVRKIDDMLAPKTAESHQHNSQYFPPINHAQTLPSCIGPLHPSGTPVCYPSNPIISGHQLNVPISQPNVPPQYPQPAQAVGQPPHLTKVYPIPVPQQVPMQNVQLAGPRLSNARTPSSQCPSYHPVHYNSIPQPSPVVPNPMVDTGTPSAPQITGHTIAQSYGLGRPVSNAPVAGVEAQQGGGHSVQTSREILKNNCIRLVQALMKLFNNRPEPVASDARKMLQELISGKIDCEYFIATIQRMLNTPLAPTFAPSIKKYFPFLAYFLSTKELSYDESTGVVERPKRSQLAISWTSTEAQDSSAVQSKTDTRNASASPNTPNLSCPLLNAALKNAVQPEPVSSTDQKTREESDEISARMPMTSVPSSVIQNSNRCESDNRTVDNVSTSSNSSNPVLLPAQSDPLSKIRDKNIPMPTMSSGMPRKRSTPLNELCKVAVSYAQRLSLQKDVGKETSSAGATRPTVTSVLEQAEKIAVKTEKADANESSRDGHETIVNNDNHLSSNQKLAAQKTAPKPVELETNAKVAQPPQSKTSTLDNTTRQCFLEGKSLIEEFLLNMSTPYTKDAGCSKTCEIPAANEALETKLEKPDQALAPVPSSLDMEVDRSAIVEPDDTVAHSKTVAMCAANADDQQGSSKGVKRSLKMPKKSRSKKVSSKVDTPRNAKKASKRKLTDCEAGDGRDSDLCDTQPQKKRGNYDVRPCSVILRPFFRIHLPEGAFQISR